MHLKSGDVYWRGLDEIGPDVRQHFQVSPIRALQLKKTAEDNRTQIPLSFIARLTGNDEDEPGDPAVKRDYAVDEQGGEEPMRLSVIGAGFGRTGTVSLRKALEILGSGPCYHILEALPHRDRVDMRAGLAQGATPDRDQFVRGRQRNGRLAGRSLPARGCRSQSGPEAYPVHPRRRELVQLHLKHHPAGDVPQRRACGLLGVNPRVYRYRSTRPDDAGLRQRLYGLAAEHRRFDSRAPHLLLKRVGCDVS